MAGGESQVNQDNKRPWKEEAIANVFRKTKKGKKKADPAQGNGGSSARAEVVLAPEEYVRIIPVTKDDSKAQLSDTVHLSSKDKATQMQLSSDKLGVTSHKGYRTVKATHGVYFGTWYCEVQVKHLGTTGHCRLGWCTKKAELQAPVGFDAYGFSYRDVDGSKVHKSWRDEYGSPYKEGDVIGMLIHLPPGGKPMEHFHKEQVQFKGAMYYIDSPDPEPQQLPGSFIGFFKNGEWQGQAYTDLNEGTYYPSASLYTMPEQTEGATVTFNFGPDFDFSPAAVEGAPAPKPYADVAKLPPPSRPSTPPADPAEGKAGEVVADAAAAVGAAGASVPEPVAAQVPVLADAAAGAVPEGAGAAPAPAPAPARAAPTEAAFPTEHVAAPAQAS